MQCGKNGETFKLERAMLSGIEVITLSRKFFREHFIRVPFPSEDATGSAISRIAEVLRSLEARVVSQEVFGVSSREGMGFRQLEEGFREITWPVTWILRDSTEGILRDSTEGDTALLSGTQIHAVSGVPVEPLERDGTVVGTLFEDGWARYCRIGGLLPTRQDAAPDHQAHEVLLGMEAVLAQAGMAFENVARTWFFNRDILAWYGDFNRARHAFFEKRGVFQGLVPASTGVGAQNAQGAALTAGLFAVLPLDGRVKVRSVSSALQCQALDYGSSFSRAVEITFPDHDRLLISGTASIATDGHTAHPGDPDGQVALTMRVVKKLLESRAMDWRNVTRAIVYFKDPQDIRAFIRWFADHLDKPFPVLAAACTICRGDLLFEIELDAVK